MKDNPENLKLTSPDSSERLETVAFHLTHLYQRLAQDRDRWAVTGGDLAEVVEIFSQQLHQLEILEARLQEKLIASLEEKTRQVTACLSESFKQATKEVLSEDIEKTADHLIKIFQNVDQVLSHHQQDMVNTRKWWFIIALISSLLGSIMGGAILYFLSQ